jgi:hypothetical protein
MAHSVSSVDQNAQLHIDQVRESIVEQQKMGAEENYREWRNSIWIFGAAFFLLGIFAFLFFLITAGTASILMVLLILTGFFALGAGKLIEAAG